MSKHITDSEIEALKKILTVALALYLLIGLVVFCVSLFHAPADPCPPSRFASYHPDCKFPR